MMFRFLLTLAIAAIMGLSACEKSEEPAPEEKASESGAVEEEKTMVEQATEIAKEGAEKATELAGAAAGKVEEMAGAAMETGEEMTDAGTETGAEITSAAAQKAETLIQQARDYIDNNQIDLAGGVMEQLRALRDSLPESLQAQIDKLEALLSSTTSASGGEGQ